MKAILVVTTCACLAGCSTSPGKKEAGPTLIATFAGPATTDKPRMLYEDDEMSIVGVGYGSPDAPQTPGFYIFGKRNQKWIRVDEVSLKDAVLGRSPTL